MDALSGKDDGLETRGADFVDGGSIGASLEAGVQGYLTGRALADTGLDDVAKVDLLNNCGIDLLGLKCSLESNNSELSCGKGFERTVKGADRCAGSSDDDSFVSLKDGCYNGCI